MNSLDLELSALTKISIVEIIHNITQKALTTTNSYSELSNNVKQNYMRLGILPHWWITLSQNEIKQQSVKNLEILFNHISTLNKYKKEFDELELKIDPSEFDLTRLNRLSDLMAEEVDCISDVYKLNKTEFVNLCDDLKEVKK